MAYPGDRGNKKNYPRDSLYRRLPTPIIACICTEDPCICTGDRYARSRVHGRWLEVKLNHSGDPFKIILYNQETALAGNRFNWRNPLNRKPLSPKTACTTPCAIDGLRWRPPRPELASAGDRSFPEMTTINDCQ